MTVGERIQFHRKKQNLSQEELGQRLCLSRQTISLWETDQTLPSVDNLLLLKDIFGISMDELLGVESRPEDVPAPLEVHTFTYEEAPLKNMYKSQLSVLVMFLVFLVALTVVAWLGQGEWNDGVLVGILLMADVVMSFLLWNNVKERRNTLSKFPHRTVTVSLYEADFVMETVREGEKESRISIPYSEIDNVVADTAFYQLYHGSKMYLFPMGLFQKGALDPDTRLETLLKNNLGKNKRAPVKGAWRLLSFGLVYLCILAPFLGVLAAAGLGALLDGDAFLLFDYFWVYFLMLVIPAASVAVGLYLRHKKKKALKNIVAGLLCGLVLFSIGSGGGSSDYTDAELAEDTFAWAEYSVGLVLPETELVINTLYEEWEADEEYLFSSVCIAVVTPSAREEFEATLTEDSGWLKDLPHELKATLPFEGGYDRILLYNAYTGEINCMPEEEGWYQLACFLYDEETGIVTVWEYPWERTVSHE